MKKPQEVLKSERTVERIETIIKNHIFQIDPLLLVECEKIFIDKISGTVSDRAELKKLKEQLRKGDTLVIWRLDRLERSLKDLLNWMAELETLGVSFKSLQENIDTSTPTGKLVFHLFGALSDFEKSLIQERTKAGLTAARARGRVGGMNKKLSKTGSKK